MASTTLQLSQSLGVGTSRWFCFQADAWAWEAGTLWRTPELIREFPREAYVTAPQKYPQRGGGTLCQGDQG